MDHKTTPKGHLKSLTVPARDDTSGDEEDDTRLVIDEENPEYDSRKVLPHLTLPSSHHSNLLLSCGLPLDLDKTQHPQIKTEVFWDSDFDEESCEMERESLMEKDPLMVKDPLMIKDPLMVKDPLNVKDSLTVKDRVTVKEPLMVKAPLMVKEPLKLKKILLIKKPFFVKDPFAKEKNTSATSETVPVATWKRTDPVEKEKSISSGGKNESVKPSFACPTCPKTFVRKMNLAVHMRTHKPGIVYKCGQCGESFEKKRLLNFHVYCHNNQTYECFECSKRFILKRTLLQHQREHENSSQMEIDEADSSKTNVSSFPNLSGYWSLKCKKCGKVSSNQHEYDKHLNMQCESLSGADSGAHSNLSCKDELEFHLETFRKKSQIPVKTDDIEKQETNSCNFRNISPQSSKSVSCEICDETFQTAEQLKTHMCLHTITKASCPTCKKDFKTKKALSLHMLSHKLGSVTQDQQFCKKEKVESEGAQVYKTEKVDDVNVRPVKVVKNIDKKLFVCHKCGEDFKSKEVLLEHIPTHLQCKKCKKIFNTQRALDFHLLFLGDKKLMSCVICGNLLHGKKELERHLSDHVTAEYKSSKNSAEWEEKTKKIQSIIVGLNEDQEGYPVRETKVKINKVTPAGNNSMRCASCRKIVHLRHSLKAHNLLSTDKAEADEEFVYISRLGNHNKRNKPGSYCTCTNSAESLLVAASETLSKSKNGEKRGLASCKEGAIFKKAKHSHSAKEQASYSSSQDGGRSNLRVVDLESLLERSQQHGGRELSSIVGSDVMVKIGREVGPDSFKSRIDVVPNVIQTRPHTKPLFDKTTIKKEIVPPSEVIIKEEWDVDLCAS